MSESAPVGTTKRPNILWIIADQLRADHVGFGGNPVVRTPNLDALAARATVFDRAWVANPICMPNRCSMLTGRMPSAHGVVFNDRSLAWNANTFVRELAGAGYRTALIGKSHIQHGLSRNVVREQREAPTLANPYPDGFYSGGSREEKYVGLRESYFSWEWGDALFVVLDPYWNTPQSPELSGDWSLTLGREQYAAGSVLRQQLCR